jgi:hypothetical protein
MGLENIVESNYISKKMQNSYAIESIFAPNMSFMNDGIQMGPKWEANPNNPNDWIYNQEVGWREKTWEERHPPYSIKNNFLNPIVGERILRPTGEGTFTVGRFLWDAATTTLKFTVYGVGAGAIAIVVWNSFAYVKNEVMG